MFLRISFKMSVERRNYTNSHVIVYALGNPNDLCSVLFWSNTGPTLALLDQAINKEPCRIIILLYVYVFYLKFIATFTGLENFSSMYRNCWSIMHIPSSKYKYFVYVDKTMVVGYMMFMLCVIQSHIAVIWSCTGCFGGCSHKSGRLSDP